MPGLYPLVVAVAVAVTVALTQVARAEDVWVRGGESGNEPHWGIRGGLQFAISPASRGPRGLVRILYPTLPDQRYDLINFIAIEPIVKGQRGFSELEHSQLDDQQGKRLWVEPEALGGTLDDASGTLEVTVHVEKFDNGAHLRLVLAQRRDRPEELVLTVHPEPDSAEMQYCILTATMGNKARARLLWLGDQTVSSLKLYPDYADVQFAPHTIYRLDRFMRMSDGAPLVAITTDEARPADVRPFPETGAWYYGGVPVTQYWRKDPNTFRDDLHVAINARYTYWKSRRAIPGGISFENFELRERFYPGQQFIFGITTRTPREFFASDDAP